MNRSDNLPSTRAVTSACRPWCTDHELGRAGLNHQSGRTTWRGPEDVAVQVYLEVVEMADAIAEPRVHVMHDEIDLSLRVDDARMLIAALEDLVTAAGQAR